MLVCIQLALLIAGSPSLAAESTLLVPLPASASASASTATNWVSESSGELSRDFAALPQGTLDAHAQPWFISGGFHYISADYSVNMLSLGDFSDNPGYSVDIGFTKWSDEMGVALEGGLLKSTTDVEVNLATETVDSLRLLVGVRAFDSGSDSWLPYLRGGFMWRDDSGDSISDSGSGWYLGGGFDWYLGSNFRVGPQLLYTNSSSLNAQEWILGAVVTFAF